MSESNAEENSNVQQPASTASPAIDIEKLAEKVYQLMRMDARQERARRGGQRTNTRR